MAKPDLNETAKPEVKAKDKVLAFVNWSIVDPDTGETLLRSNRGFSIIDNKYLTLEDKALVQLATDNDGVAVVNAQLRIVIHHERPESLDVSKIKVIKK
jgi:hypothetical protein